MNLKIEIENGSEASILTPVLSLPLVVRVKILSYLTLKEHLILRQVCQTTKEWIDNTTLAYHSPVTIVFDHGSKTFSRFFKDRRPPHVITSLRIKNGSLDFLQDPALPLFLQIYSASITSLHMERFFPCCSSSQLAFFEAFTNLVELQLDKISIPSDSDPACSFPSTFKNLKTLKLGSVKAYPEPPDDTFGAALIPFPRQRPMGLYVWSLIRHCENIEFLGYPRTSKYFFQAFVDGRGRGEFGVFCDYVRNRRLESPTGPCLKYCDFQHDNWDPDTKNALPLLKLGNEFGIKFLNLNANLFQYIKIETLIRMYDLPSTAADCILSFKHFNCLINKCLPTVKKISMSASEVNTMLDYSCMFNGPKTFPNLQEIEIIVDKGFNRLEESDVYHRARAFRDVKTLLGHFFYDMEMILDVDRDTILKHVRIYESVHTLTIRFDDLPSHQELRKANPEELPLDWIAKSLPNLKKLMLHGWSTQCVEIYGTFCESFPKLEEIVIDECNIWDGNQLNAGIQKFKGLARIAIKKTENSLDLHKNSLDDLLEDYGFHSSIHLDKSNHHEKLFWIKLSEHSQPFLTSSTD